MLTLSTFIIIYLLIITFKVGSHEVQIEDQTYYNVEMGDFLKFTQDEVKPNNSAVEAYRKLVSLLLLLFVLLLICFE